MPTDLPPNIATFGGDIDAVISFIWWIVGVWFVASEALLVYLLIRYRKRDGERAAWMPADTLKTTAWVLVPVFLVLLCDLAIEAKSHGVWDHVKGELPAHDELVRVTARQFAWTFTYAGGDGELDTADDFRTVSELHVPRGENVRFELESVDVLHAFWVPALRLKQDAVPGRTISGWFNATEEGSYDLACAELCGPAHGAMRGKLVVHAADSYRAWSAAMAEQHRELASYR